MLKKLQKLVWKEDGDSHQDSTLAYSEMPGELDKFKEIKYTQEQRERLEKAMNAPIDHEALRKKGL